MIVNNNINNNNNNNKYKYKNMKSKQIHFGDLKNKTRKKILKKGNVHLWSKNHSSHELSVQII